HAAQGAGAEQVAARQAVTKAERGTWQAEHEHLGTAVRRALQRSYTVGDGLAIRRRTGRVSCPVGHHPPGGLYPPADAAASPHTPRLTQPVRRPVVALRDSAKPTAGSLDRARTGSHPRAFRPS